MSVALSMVAMVRALEEAWASLAPLGVPPAVILVGAGSDASGVTLGHFEPARWLGGTGDAVNEVAIAGELLTQPASSILSVLLHEAAHALAWDRHLLEVGHRGYHNRQFQRLALELGLDATRHPRTGYNHTQIQPAAVRQHAATIRRIEDARLAGGSAFRVTPRVQDELVGPRRSPEPAARPSRIRAVCDCPKIVWVPAGVLERGRGLGCLDCKARLRAQPTRAARRA